MPRGIYKRNPVVLVKLHEQRMKKQPKRYREIAGKYIGRPEELVTREHRAVAERKIGRAILSSEHVHHLDGNIHNNSPENLIVVPKDWHKKLHAGWVLTVAGWLKTCSRCKRNLLVNEENFYRRKKSCEGTSPWLSRCKPCVLQDNNRKE